VRGDDLRVLSRGMKLLGTVGMSYVMTLCLHY
jgi:hypothetical protein